MLALTRRPGQTLRIGQEITVEVVRIEGDRVVLGIVAPREIPVVRGELVSEIGGEVGRAAEGRSAILDILRPAE